MDTSWIAIANRLVCRCRMSSVVPSRWPARGEDMRCYGHWRWMKIPGCGVFLWIHSEHSHRFDSAGARDLLQSIPAPSLAPAQLSDANLRLLTATQAVSLLCSRQITAVQYVTALDNYYRSSGYECTNPWITYNITQVSCTPSTPITSKQKIPQ